jgi:hypothetical protein
MKVTITPQQKQQIRASAQQLIQSIDAGLPSKAITLGAARISETIAEAVRASRREAERQAFARLPKLPFPAVSLIQV